MGSEREFDEAFRQVRVVSRHSYPRLYNRWHLGF